MKDVVDISIDQIEMVTSALKHHYTVVGTSWTELTCLNLVLTIEIKLVHTFKSCLKTSRTWCDVDMPQV